MTSLQDKGLEWEILADRISSKAGKGPTFSIVYLEIIDFDKYLNAIPEEYREAQRKKVMHHIQLAVANQVVAETVAKDRYLVNEGRYTHGNNIILYAGTNIEHISELETRVTDTIRGTLKRIETEDVQVVEDLDPNHVNDFDITKIKARAGIVNAFSNQVNVRSMLLIAENLLEENQVTSGGYGASSYSPISMAPPPPPQD